jgi:hypothetical protein
MDEGPYPSARTDRTTGLLICLDGQITARHAPCLACVQSRSKKYFA